MSQDTPGADAKGVAPSLDNRTQLPGEGPVAVSIYPECGEAVLTYSPIVGSNSTESRWSDLSEEQKALKNHSRANRRAKTESRRYILSNRLRYMWVLTFAEEHQGVEGRARCMAEVARFAERLTAAFGRQAYWYSPELHPEGHGWHVNFFVARRIPHPKFKELWGQGHVWVKDWAADSRVTALQLSFVESLRLGAAYGSKYAAKDWGTDVLADGAHRYEVAQGFKPRQLVYRVRTFTSATMIAEAAFGGLKPPDVWLSSSCDDWDGPPVRILRWHYSAAACRGDR